MIKKVYSIALPILAGLLHFNVFYQSLFTFIITRLENYENEDIYHLFFNIEKAIFVTYTFDLICCYGFNIVPFSRCSKTSEIAMHHLPILLIILPLGVPIYAKKIDLDPIFHGITELDINNDINNSMRLITIESLRKVQGFGFISSFNEFIMCLQRAEMNLLGIESFHQIAEIKGRRKLMTSTMIIGVELYFKLAIFWIFPLFSITACLNLDKLFYEFYIIQNKGSNVLNAVMSICSSPTSMRLIIFRVFMILLYPNMGLRTLKKILALHAKSTRTMVIEKQI